MNDSNMRKWKILSQFFKGRQQINEIWLEKQVDLLDFLRNIKLMDQKYHLNFQKTYNRLLHQNVMKCKEKKKKQKKPVGCVWRISKSLKDRKKD